ncbi:MAG: sodium:solute symporter family protein [Pirellulales bacterium]
MSWGFGGALVVYLLVMYGLGFAAQRRVTDVEDYVLAGRGLSLGLTTLTIVATWFGAESLMTTADEVAAEGVRKALLDPLGISLCLVIAGLFIAGPMWRMNLMTIPDFFHHRYGKTAEVLSSLILVPSYFGWIAAQYAALALIISQIYGLPIEWCIVGTAILGTGYSLMGGMVSITWTDALQMLFIVAGLIILGYEGLRLLGDGDMVPAVARVRNESDPRLWRIADDETAVRDWLAALSAVTIGSLGNLPVQDLMQRIFSARSDRTAARACLLGAAGYLMMGLLPIGTGLAAALLLDEVPEEGVITAVAHRLLSGPLMIVFLLAIVSAVLSTIVSAVMAPAAVMAHNLIEPAMKHRDPKLSAAGGLMLQRACVVGVAAAAMLLALSGRGAYELVQDAYAMSLVGMFVPFVGGLMLKRVTSTAAIASMGVGIGSWLLHVVMGWEHFVGGPWPVPHEIVDTLLSGGAFWLGLLRRGGNVVGESDSSRRG